jgi:phenylacetate-coenzyme A ligase PaaK-like adenylate-forming protein
MSSSGETFSLLSNTLRRAVNESPYYARVMRGIDTQISGPDDLLRIPMLTRRTLETRIDEIMVPGTLPATIAMTSGTLTGRPLVSFRSEIENSVRRELYESLQARSHPRALVLYIAALGHGYDPDSQRDGFLQVPLERPFHFEIIVDLLRRQFSIPGYTDRIFAVAGSLRHLKALTLMCQENSIDPREFRVALLSCSGEHLTSKYRHIFAEAWGALTEDVYGLSEGPGLCARRCAACEKYHFSPLAHVEILSLDRDEPIDVGAGRLVATSFFPLAAALPIIRYDTGDIMSVATELCPKMNQRSFEYIGRSHQVIKDIRSGDTKVLLPTMIISEVLDRLPDIAYSRYGFLKQLGAKSAFGPLKWSVSQFNEGQLTKVELLAELRWSERQFPEAAQALRSLIASNLKSAWPDFGTACSKTAAELVVSFAEPGSSTLEALV